MSIIEKNISVPSSPNTLNDGDKYFAGSCVLERSAAANVAQDVLDQFTSPQNGKRPLEVQDELNRSANISVQVRDRRFPPLSLKDTIVLDFGTKQIVSVHGQGNYFDDNEILCIHDVVKKVLINGERGQPGIFVLYTKNNKAIIQQQATRGCTAAVTAMLIMDHGKHVSVVSLRSRNLGNTEGMKSDLKQCGLTAVQFQEKSWESARVQLETQGSAIISLVDSQMGGHVCVLDAMDQNSARIREPYHGWEITVTREALEKRWNFDLMQVSSS